MLAGFVTRRLLSFLRPARTAKYIMQAYYFSSKDDGQDPPAFGLTDDQREFDAVARDFANRELSPFAAEWDAKKHFPVSTLRAAAQLGFGGILVGEDVGKLVLDSTFTELGTQMFLLATPQGCSRVSNDIACYAGGSGLCRADAAVIYEALAYGDISVTAYLTIHNMVANCIDKYALVMLSVKSSKDTENKGLQVRKWRAATAVLATANMHGLAGILLSDRGRQRQ